MPELEELGVAACSLCSLAVVRCSSQMEVNREMANKRPQSGIFRFFPVRGDKAYYSIAEQPCSLSEPPPVPGPVPFGDWGDWGTTQPTARQSASPKRKRDGALNDERTGPGEVGMPRWLLICPVTACGGACQPIS